MKPKREDCGYIIVGAGSTGRTLAYPFSADRDVRVVLHEAAGGIRDPLLHIPLAWGRGVLRLGSA